MINILLGQRHLQAHEFQLAIRHSLELIHHIQPKERALQWNNRFRLIQQNKPLRQALKQAVFVCLQECTSLKNMHALFDQIHVFLTQKISIHTNDHCALIYNQVKFKCIGKTLVINLEEKNPCLFANFQDKAIGEQFVVASIYHPGGNKNLIAEIKAHINHFSNDKKIWPTLCWVILITRPVI